jgi:hypothetical protein
MTVKNFADPRSRSAQAQKIRDRTAVRVRMNVLASTSARSEVCWGRPPQGWKLLSFLDRVRLQVSAARVRGPSRRRPRCLSTRLPSVSVGADLGDMSARSAGDINAAPGCRGSQEAVPNRDCPEAASQAEQLRRQWRPCRPESSCDS